MISRHLLLHVTESEEKSDRRSKCCMGCSRDTSNVNIDPFILIGMYDFAILQAVNV